MSLTDTSTPLSDESRQQVRVDLAAAFRWTARMNMHEGISNHFIHRTCIKAVGNSVIIGRCCNNHKASPVVSSLLI